MSGSAKPGSGTLTFTPVTPLGNTTEGSGYRGGTIIEGGKIAIAIDSALGFVPLSADADNLTLAGGTLRALASFTLAQNRGVVLGAGGGTVEVDPTFTAGIDGGITGSTSLSKTGTGALQLNSTANTYTGDTHIIEGVLQGGGADTLAPLSRHIVHGNLASSGTLDLNGTNQTIGSLASAGATPITATVSLGASTLTVGNDRTQNAAYAGIITGSGIFRVNGNGALQTLAVTDNSAQGWNTEIANGILNVALGGKLGSGTLTLGVTGVSGADDFTGLNLSGATSLANNITITNVNSVGSVSLTGSGGAASSLTGTIAIGSRHLRRGDHWQRTRPDRQHQWRRPSRQSRRRHRPSRRNQQLRPRNPRRILRQFLCRQHPRPRRNRPSREQHRRRQHSNRPRRCHLHHRRRSRPRHLHQHPRIRHLEPQRRRHQRHQRWTDPRSHHRQRSFHRSLQHRGRLHLHHRDRHPHSHRR
jgi:autotransporter-associated beta strand protein